MKSENSAHIPKKCTAEKTRRAEPHSGVAIFGQIGCWWEVDRNASPEIAPRGKAMHQKKMLEELADQNCMILQQSGDRERIRVAGA